MKKKREKKTKKKTKKTSKKEREREREGHMRMGPEAKPYHYSSISK
jgi:hypothetical protein